MEKQKKGKSETLTFGDLDVTGMADGDYFYVTAMINFDGEILEDSILEEIVDFWEGKIKGNGFWSVFLSPALLSYFKGKAIKELDKRGYALLSEDDVENIKEDGYLKVNGLHYYKVVEAKGSNHGLDRVEINEIIFDYIDEIEEKEPRTSIYKTGVRDFKYVFGFRGTVGRYQLKQVDGVHEMIPDGKGKHYPMKNKEEIKENVRKLLMDTYNKERVRFITNPPTEYFNAHFGCHFLGSQREKIHSLLLKHYSFNEIEDLCYLKKPIKILKNNKHVAIISFDQNYLLYKGNTFKFYEKKEEEKVKRLYKDEVRRLIEEEMDADLNDFLKV